MNNCPACLIASDYPKTGHYIVDCPECTARAMAQAPMFYSATKMHKRTPEYIVALKILFGTEHEYAHERVKYWAGQIKGVV